MKQPENIKIEILQLIKNNSKISRKDLALILNVTEGSINKLREEKIIEHVGPDKGGYWKVNDKDTN